MSISMKLQVGGEGLDNQTYIREVRRKKESTRSQKVRV